MESLVSGNYILIYSKLFPYTISDSDLQTPLLRFLLRGGVCKPATRDVVKSGLPASSTSWNKSLPPAEFANQNKDVEEF